MNPCFISTQQLAKISQAINQEFAYWIKKLSQQDQEAQVIWTQYRKKVTDHLNEEVQGPPISYTTEFTSLIDSLLLKNE